MDEHSVLLPSTSSPPLWGSACLCEAIGDLPSDDFRIGARYVFYFPRKGTIEKAPLSETRGISTMLKILINLAYPNRFTSRIPTGPAPRGTLAFDIGVIEFRLWLDMMLTWRVTFSVRSREYLGVPVVLGLRVGRKGRDKNTEEHGSRLSI